MNMKKSLLIVSIMLIGVSFGCSAQSKVKIWAVQDATSALSMMTQFNRENSIVMLWEGLQKSKKGVFIQEKCDDGSYIFRVAENPDLVITVEDGIARDGQPIEVHKYNGSDSQKWFIESSYRDTGKFDQYIVSALNTNYVMYSGKAPLTNGTSIVLCRRLPGNKAERFTFSSASDVKF